MKSGDFSSDFYKDLRKASKNGSIQEDDSNAANELSEEEKTEWESEESNDSDTLAEIKKAQAISNEKFSKLKRKLLKGQIRLQEQDTKMRKEYASKAYSFVWVWSLTLIIILLFQGFNFPASKFWLVNLDVHGFHLDDKVIIALISGVTVNIVAVFIVVMRNLFPSNVKDSSKEKDSTAE